MYAQGMLHTYICARKSVRIVDTSNKTDQATEYHYSNEYLSKRLAITICKEGLYFG